ncbi:MAG: hypothetical protein ACYTCV_08630 [Planctomycetota bacterium]
MKINYLCLTAAVTGVRYYSTTLKLSTSADVLAMVQDPDTEMLSQSDSVVAAWGVKGKKDRTHWFNMVAFDQDQMNAVRKYGFILEEINENWNRPPKPALRLDAAYVMEADVLDAAYANGNEKLIEILKAAEESFEGDAKELTFDSKSFRNSTIMVQQAFKSVLYKLGHSPAYAAKLPLYEGLAFDHPTLGDSRIRMVIDGDIVKVKIKCSKRWFTDQPFEEQNDVLFM